jgi:hypothetical protein
LSWSQCVASKQDVPIGGLRQRVWRDTGSILGKDVAGNTVSKALGKRQSLGKGVLAGIALFAKASGVYLSNPTMIRPWTSVTTRKEIVQTLILGNLQSTWANSWNKLNKDRDKQTIKGQGALLAQHEIRSTRLDPCFDAG